MWQQSSLGTMGRVYVCFEIDAGAQLTVSFNPRSPHTTEKGSLPPAQELADKSWGEVVQNASPSRSKSKQVS